jgi:hypothetical protein
LGTATKTTLKTPFLHSIFGKNSIFWIITGKQENFVMRETSRAFCFSVTDKYLIKVMAAFIVLQRKLFSKFVELTLIGFCH